MVLNFSVIVVLAAAIACPFFSDDNFLAMPPKLARIDSIGRAIQGVAN